MSVLAVVGGQYGGEGKGKMISFLDYNIEPDIIAKGSGPNSAHRVVSDSFDYTFRMLPAHIRQNSSVFVFGAGTLIDIEELFKEISLCNCKSNVRIDPRAGIIDPEYITEQKNDIVYSRIGTTYRGTGVAAALRARRRLKLAKEFSGLRDYIINVPDYLYSNLKQNKKILLEGSQSTQLSNYHGDYPYCTSRDTTVSALCSQLGIGIKFIDDILLVVKCFPTRNHAGSLPNEFSKDEIKKNRIKEVNCDGIQRRVGKMDFDVIKNSVMINSATQIALTGIDYYDFRTKGADSKSKLTAKAFRLIEKLENATNLNVKYVSTGPKYYETVVLN